MNKQEQQQELYRRLGSLFSVSLRIGNPVEQLHLIREKMAQRGYQPFDKEDILSALGNLQQTVMAVNNEMLRIHDLLKNQSQNQS